jgi:23S rRNA (cytidine1920-2'-O)/16S rRNA (cytidine1409-2'-O)-methyltransferase
MRLDKYLVLEGYFESRNRALEAIKSAQVTVDGHSAKPSTHIGENTLVEVADAKYYVSRAARKLEGFLSKYPLELEDKRALDVGSSTGGFTQILLEQRTAHVDCVDVGRDQLHASLRNDPRVGVHEQTDIRDFYTDTPYEVIVSDVSFISLLHILDAIDRLSAKGAQIVLLFKPQFEVGREASRDRRGVVTDEGAIQRAMDAFELATDKLGWQRLQKTPSQYRGREGNQEWVYLFQVGSRK